MAGRRGQPHRKSGPILARMKIVSKKGETNSSEGPALGFAGLPASDGAHFIIGYLRFAGLLRKVDAETEEDLERFLPSALRAETLSRTLELTLQHGRATGGLRSILAEAEGELPPWLRGVAETAPVARLRDDRF